MKQKRFDDLVRLLVTNSRSRRTSLRLLTGGMLAGVLMRQKQDEAIAGCFGEVCGPSQQCCSGTSCGTEGVCCRSHDGRCSKNAQCCSGRCKRKHGARRGHCTCPAGTAPCGIFLCCPSGSSCQSGSNCVQLVDRDACPAGAQPCDDVLRQCDTDGTCYCATGSGGATICAAYNTGFCTDCRMDADCERLRGTGWICVPAGPNPNNGACFCSGGQAAWCVGPCPPPNPSP
jgi:hypothetical protein